MLTTEKRGNLTLTRGASRAPRARFMIAVIAPRRGIQEGWNTFGLDRPV